MTKRLLRIALCALPALLMLYPTQALFGAKQGLSTFLDTVLPALLPYYVGTSILLKSGLARSITRYLTPLLKPFGLPGQSAFPFFMGALSGYPTGARLTAELYEYGMLTQHQARGTAILSSCCGPSFMMAAVAAGMLKIPGCGIIIAAAHYCSVLTAAFLLKPFYHSPKDSPGNSTIKPKVPGSITTIVLDSIADSAVSLWTVGGYLIFFSSLISVFSATGVLNLIGGVLTPVLSPLGIHPSTITPILCGMVEMTDGCTRAAMAFGPISSKVISCTFIITLGGGSIFAQSFNYLRRCSIKPGLFLVSKLTSAVFSLFYSSLLLYLFPQAAPASVALTPSFERTLGGNTTIMIIGVLVISFLGAAMSLYNLRSYKHKK
ncbi:MAG: hypothetical protein E7328_01205 [Clostridiales bacterium]|nr:hypothetical protein [Clostridiales bacterium]